MMDKDKWAARFSQKMKDYSEPLPDGLWERLEAEMSPSRRVIPMWRSRRFAVAAAAALVVAVSGLTAWLAGFWIKDAGYPDSAVAEKEMPLSLPDEQPQLPSVSSPLVKNPSVAPLLAVSSEVLPEKATVELSAVITEPDVLEPTVEEKPEPTEKTVSSHPVPMTRSQRRMADQEQMRRNQEALETRREPENRSWSVGVHTGNTPFSSSNSFNGVGRLSTLQTTQASVMDMVMASDDGGRSAYNQILFNNRDQASRTDVHHKMPVTVGASFRWNFAPRWALETGLAYTLLSSDLRSGKDSYLEEEQKLHYVGIPLKLHRSLFDSRWVSLYASAGGMVEKCVSASLNVVYVNGMASRETESQSLDIDEIQWSVSAAAGVQVNITPQIGLYAEPGIAYYFDDGSDVETIRKEHPFNFNLQVGLRFSFPK